MKLAVCQIAWQPEEEEKALAMLQAGGYAAVEIVPPRIAGQAPYENMAAAGEYAARVKRDYSLDVCSMQSIWFGQSGNIFGPEQAALRDYTKKAICFAAAGGIGNLVFGCPKNRTMGEGQSPKDVYPFLKELGDDAAQKGTRFSLEALPPAYGTNFANSTAEALAIVEEVGSPGFRLNVDYSTMLTVGEVATVLEGHVGSVAHVHISDANLGMIEQREGHRALAGVLRAEGYEGYVSIEMKAQSLENIGQAMAYIAEVFA